MHLPYTGHDVPSLFVFPIQTELGNARDSLAKANQELEAFRKFRDELSAASEEACRTRGDLENARRATSEMSARAAEAEGRAEEARCEAKRGGDEGSYSS